MAPDVLAIDFSFPTSTQLDVDVFLSLDGLLYCAVVGDKDVAGLSIWLIKSRGQKAHSNNLRASLTFRSISPSSNHNIFCVTYSYAGNEMILGNVLKTRTVATSPCCRHVSATLQDHVIVTVNAVVAETILLAIQEPPPADMEARIVVEYSSFGAAARRNLVASSAAPAAVTLANASTHAIYPESVIFRADFGGDNLKQSVAFTALVPGVFTFSLDLSGSSSRSYVTRFTSKSELYVYSSTDDVVDAPLIEYAAYVDDGSHIEIKFNGPTNRGGISSLRGSSCDVLMDFASAANANCVWADASRVHISSKHPALAVGETLTVRAGVIRSQCISDNATLCASYPLIDATHMLVTDQTGIVPYIGIVAPRVVSNESWFHLDISSSYGSGGYKWATAEVTVRSPTGATVSAVNAFYSEADMKSSVVPPLPPSYWTVGHMYIFTATLCNVMNNCGSSDHVVTVRNTSILDIVIVGPRFLQLRANESIQLRTQIIYDSALYAIIASLKPTYEWFIYDHTSSLFLTNLTAVYGKPGKLTTPPLAIPAGAKLEVWVSVRYDSDGVQVAQSSSVFAHVIKDPPVAVHVSPARSAQVARNGSDLVFKATILGLDAVESLTVACEWNCMKMISSHFLPCSSSEFQHSNPSSAASSDISAILFAKGLSTVVRWYLVSVSLVDTYDALIVSSSVHVTVLDPELPIVYIAPHLGRIDPSTALTVSGSIAIASTGYAQWLLHDQALETLHISPLSPAVFVFDGDSSHSVLSNLVIPPNTFAGDASYILSLSAAYGSGPHVSATLTVISNSPPRAGLLSVIPPTGLEFVDAFVLTATLWADSDVPLTYQFGYTSSAGVRLTINMRSAASSVSTLLPQGSNQITHELSCVVEVYDSLLAASRLSHHVEVLPSVPVRTDDLSAELHRLLDWNDLDGLDHLLSVYCTAANVVDCKLAPNCSSLGREPCSSAAGTCGMCAATAPLGEDGHHNSACVSTSQLENSHSCVALSECQPFKVCVDGTCQPLEKSCPQDCSENGYCIFVSNSGEQVSSCSLGDPTCEAHCECMAGWYGRGCSVDTDTMSDRVELLQVLACGLRDLAERETLSVEGAQSWLAILRTLSSDTFTMTYSTADCMLTTLRSIFHPTHPIRLSMEDMERALSGIDALLRLDDFFDFPSISPTQREHLVEQASILLESACDVIVGGMSLGQFPYNSSTSRFMLSAVLVPSKAEYTLAVPLSPTETYWHSSDEPISYFTTTANRYGSAQCAVRVASRVYLSLTSTPISSHPLSIITDDASLQDGDYFEVVASLHTLADIKYEVVYNESTAILNCSSDSQLGSPLRCTDGRMLTGVTCANITGSVSVSCPRIVRVPVCNTLDGLSIRESICVAETRDGAVTCRCPSSILHGTNSRSKVSAGSIKRYNRVTLVATAKLVTDDVRFSSRSAGDGVLGAAHSRMVLYTVCAVVLCAQIGWYCGEKADYKAQHSTKKKVGTIVADRSRSHSSLEVLFSTEEQLAAVNTLFPNFFRDGSLLHIFILDIKQSHKWMALYFQYLPSMSRWLRLCSLVTTCIATMFFLSVMYAYVIVDDGKCETLAKPSSCERDQSNFAWFENKCEWDRSGEACRYREPGNSMQGVLMIAVLSALLAAPVVLVNDILIARYLARPAASAVVPTNKREYERNELISTRAKRVVSVIAEALQGRSNKIRTECTAAEDRGRLSGSEAGLSSPQTAALNLLTSLDRYRAGLSASERLDLDQAWGLDIQGTKELLLSGGDVISVDTESAPVFAGKSALLDDIRDVWKRATMECAKMSPLPSDEKGKRLLFLLQQDLLLDSLGTFASRHCEYGLNNAINTPVSKHSRLAAGVAVFFLNAGLLHTVLVFAINQSEVRQIGWVQSFFVWLLLDIFVISTVEIVASRMIVSAMVYNDMQRVKSTMLRAIFSTYAEELPSRPSADMFDASQYLFVSNRVACEYSGLPVSQVVLGFTTTLPKRSYRNTTKSASCPPLITWLMLRSRFMECFFWNEVTWTILGFIGFINAVMFEAYPASFGTLSFTLSMVLIGTSYYSLDIVRRGSSLSQISTNKVSVPTTAANVDESKFGDDCIVDVKSLAQNRVGQKSSLVEMHPSPRKTSAAHTVAIDVNDTEKSQLTEQLRRQASIVKYIKHMMGEHQADLGYLSDEDKDGDGESNRPKRRPRLAAILRKPGGMDKLFDLSSSSDEEDRDQSKHEVSRRRMACRRSHGSMKESSRPQEQQPMIQLTINVNDRIDDDQIHIRKPERVAPSSATMTSNFVPRSPSSNRQKAIIDYMQKMVDDNQATLGRLSDESSSEDWEASDDVFRPKLASLLHKPGMLSKLRELDQQYDMYILSSSSGDEELASYHLDRDHSTPTSGIMADDFFDSNSESHSEHGTDTPQAKAQRTRELQVRTVFSSDAGTNSSYEGDDDMASVVASIYGSGHSPREHTASEIASFSPRIIVARADSGTRNYIAQAKKNFVIGQTEDTLAKKFEKDDARKRLETRLGQMRSIHDAIRSDGPEESQRFGMATGKSCAVSAPIATLSIDAPVDEEKVPAHENRKGRELLTRLAVNTQRHRISLVKKQESAQFRLVNRIRNRQNDKNTHRVEN